MDNLKELVDSLNLETNLTTNDIPKVDLYMDQVIQLFENKYYDTLRNYEEKILTKTMINNYAKGKLFFPIVNKKYSKSHLILISLIYQLKGALSINDIKTTLDNINASLLKGELQELDEIYNSFLNLNKKNTESFKKDLDEKEKFLEEEINGLHEDIHNIDKILMICSLISTSNMYRKLAEKLVDEIGETSLDKKHK